MNVFFSQRECIELIWDLEFFERVRRLLLLDVISSERDCIELIKERFFSTRQHKIIIVRGAFPNAIIHYYKLLGFL